VSNPAHPHRALLWVQAELSELLPTGELGAEPVVKVGRFVVALDGADRATAERQLGELLADLKARGEA
jgi:hypothetical protein